MAVIFWVYNFNGRHGGLKAEEPVLIHIPHVPCQSFCQCHSSYLLSRCFGIAFMWEAHHQNGSQSRPGFEPRAFSLSHPFTHRNKLCYRCGSVFIGDERSPYLYCVIMPLVMMGGSHSTLILSWLTAHTFSIETISGTATSGWVETVSCEWVILAPLRL